MLLDLPSLYCEIESNLCHSNFGNHHGSYGAFETLPPGCPLRVDFGCFRLLEVKQANFPLLLRLTYYTLFIVSALLMSRQLNVRGAKPECVVELVRISFVFGFCGQIVTIATC